MILVLGAVIPPLRGKRDARNNVSSWRYQLADKLAAAVAAAAVQSAETVDAVVNSIEPINTNV